MPIYRGISGANREIKRQFRGVGGVNREIKEQYRGVGGVNRKVFTSVEQWVSVTVQDWFLEFVPANLITYPPGSTPTNHYAMRMYLRWGGIQVWTGEQITIPNLTDTYRIQTGLSAVPTGPDDGETIHLTGRLVNATTSAQLDYHEYTQFYVNGAPEPPPTSQTGLWIFAYYN